MAVTSDSYTGNGSTTTYSFNFPYLKEADVKVKLNGTTQNTTEYSLPTATTLQFNSAPANGAAILIFRNTDNSTRAASFYPGSAIKATDLNENFDQILYTAQEVDETAISSQGDDPMQGDLSMGNNKLTNLATPTATTDGANKTYVDSTIDTKIDTALTGDVVAGSSISIADNTPSSGKITLNVIAATGSNSGSLSASDKSKLDGIDIGAKDDQTAAEIRALVESATDSNVFTDADHSKLNGIDTGAKDDQTASEIKTLLQSDKLTDSEIATGALDNRYYTETEVDDNFYKLGSVAEIQSGESWSAADNKIATTAAIDARITDLVDDVGGFVPIANETSFPNANPDVNNGAGTLVSIKALSSNFTSNGSGVATIANGTVGNSTVTITGLANNTTYSATYGLIVETTSTLNTYTFHRLTPKATEITTVASNITNINTVAGANANITLVAGNNANITTVAGANTNISTVAGAISNVNTVASNITDVSSFKDLYQISTSAPSTDGGGNSLAAGDMWFDSSSNKTLKVHNGTGFQSVSPSQSVLDDIAIVSGEITFSNDLGSIADTVATGSGNNINTVADNITNINTVAGANANITTVAAANSNISTVAAANSNITAVAGNTTNINAVASNNTNINTVAGNNTNINTVAGANSNINTVAGSIADVNRYANEYTISNSSPGSPSAGDLWYDGVNNILKYYTGSAFSGIISGLTDIVLDTTPELGGHLDCNDKNLTEVGTVSGNNLQMDFGTL